MSDIRFNQWLHQSGTGGVTQLSSGHVGIGTTNPLIPVHSGNNAVLNVGVVTANNIYAGTINGTLALSDLSGINGSFTSDLTVNGPNLNISDKIRHVGDTNTAIRFPLNDTITFETGGSERLRIANDGKVGIGTDNPTEKLNIYGTNLKPVIGDRTAHTVHYTGYDSQNNTTLEISSSGTGTNVAGLNLDNPTTAANTSYKTISFSCSGTSNSEKRGALISSNNAAASDSSIKGDLTIMVNNGSALQNAMLINQYGQVTRPLQYHLHADRSGTLTGYDAGGSFGTPMVFNRIVSETKDSSLNSCFNTSNGLFTAPVTGVYIFNAAVYSASGAIFGQSWFTLNGSRCTATDWVLTTGASFIQNFQQIRLAAGNTVGFHPYASGQNNVSIYENNNHTYFKVSLIG